MRSNVSSYQYVPYKVVAEVSNIVKYRRLVALNPASESKSTDGPKSGWRQRNVIALVGVSWDGIVVGVVVVVQ